MGHSAGGKAFKAEHRALKDLCSFAGEQAVVSEFCPNSARAEKQTLQTVALIIIEVSQAQSPWLLECFPSTL